MEKQGISSRVCPVHFFLHIVLTLTRDQTGPGRWETTGLTESEKWAERRERPRAISRLRPPGGGGGGEQSLGVGSQSASFTGVSSQSREIQAWTARGYPSPPPSLSPL